MEYYILLEKLTRAMSGLGEFDIQEIFGILAELCKLLRASKGVTSFYSTVQHEKMGKGEAFVCYDSGEESELRAHMRTVTPTGMVGICDVYQARNVEPWTEEERSRVELIQQMMLSFLNRSRQGKMVERLTFYDDDGYRNTRYFVTMANRLGHEGKLKGMSAIRFNLRHFSLINHQIGRAAGNVAMRNYYDMVKEAAGEGAVVCRMGGDNFVMLCKNENLDAVIEVLRGKPTVYDANSGERTIVNAIAGVLVIPDNFEFHDAGDIMDKAISAFQSAKSDGKEEIVFSSSLMLDRKENLMRIQQLFPIALEKEEFLVYYQPKIDVSGNELTGAEALCRWMHDGKLVSPADFIPVLEQNLDICRLDFYMLDHVCRDIRRWLDEGKTPVRVSVNLSRKHMLDADLFDHIVSIVDRNRVPHQYIEIELTETTTDVEFKDLKRVVNGLQAVGIFTSVDDFGIGYSSLNLIKEIPWNVLKVDKSFLPTEEDDEKSRSSVMFKHVVAMARELGLECVAEGVETQDQVAILRKNSCNIAQGFYYDRPLPVAEFEKRMDLHVYSE